MKEENEKAKAKAVEASENGELKKSRASKQRLEQQQALQAQTKNKKPIRRQWPARGRIAS